MEKNGETYKNIPWRWIWTIAGAVIIFLVMFLPGIWEGKQREEEKKYLEKLQAEQQMAEAKNTRKKTEQHAEDFIAKREAPAFIANDGKQTPMRGHPVFIAQHATATCCRECIRKWHKMQPGRELSQVQQDYLVDIIMTWIQKELERQKKKL